MDKLGKSNNNIAKSIISGTLLLTGIAVGLLSASIVVRADESSDARDQNNVRNVSTTSSNTSKNSSQDINEMMIPLSDIETEDDLVNLVTENGTQVILDESTGKMYLAYLNEDNYIEVVEISEEELSSLVQQVNLISHEGEEVDEQDSIGIPQEYWRTTNKDQNKSNIKKLDSEDGRKAVEDAREYVRSQKK